MRACTRRDASLIVTAPCDSPFLPLTSLRGWQLRAAAVDADVAVARTGSQSHPVFALVCTRVRSHLADFLARGERKIDLWYASLRVVEVAFDDEADAFANINTADSSKPRRDADPRTSNAPDYNRRSTRTVPRDP